MGLFTLLVPLMVLQIFIISTIETSIRSDNAVNFKDAEPTTCGFYCTCSCGGSMCTLESCDTPDTVSSLDLSNQSISNINPNAFDYSNAVFITSLDLSENILAALPANVFQPLTKLQNLSLFSAFSLSWTVPANFFQSNKDLLILDMSNNQHLLTWGDDSLRHLTTLETLNISRSTSQFVTSNDIFKDLHALQRFDMSSCFTVNNVGPLRMFTLQYISTTNNVLRIFWFLMLCKKNAKL